MPNHQVVERREEMAYEPIEANIDNKSLGKESRVFLPTEENHCIMETYIREFI